VIAAVVALAAVAVGTTRARLGASVFVLGHRHAVVMAKMLATIDVLSNGRLICGAGVGWWKQELEILGAPFHARVLTTWEEGRRFGAILLPLGLSGPSLAEVGGTLPAGASA